MRTFTLTLLAFLAACGVGQEAELTRSPQPVDSSQEASVVGNLAWRAGSCSNGVFAGCAMSGQANCTDFGGPSYSNWDTAQQRVCQTACQLPNRNDYCSWVPAQCTGSTFTGCRAASQPTSNACTDFGGAWYANWNSGEQQKCSAACSNPKTACSWQPAQVVGGQFTGCSLMGQAPCTNFGSAAYSNWSQALGTACQQACTSTCPAANPNDTLADDAALQACFNKSGTVRLVPGTPGYLIASGVTVPSNTTVTSAAAPGRAKLLAASTLNAVMLQALNASNVSLTFLELDGNRPARSDANCKGYRIAGSIVNVGNVSSGLIANNRFTRALCGSAFQFTGTMEIANNLFDNNGAGTETSPPLGLEPWSDGLTLLDCHASTVHDNAFTDNTDVGIAAGGGIGCQLRNNTIVQLNRHAFSGLQLGNFIANGQGNYANAQITGNRIVGNGRLSFGLGVSMMPWSNGDRPQRVQVGDEQHENPMKTQCYEGCARQQTDPDDGDEPARSQQLSRDAEREGDGHGLEPARVGAAQRRDGEQEGEPREGAAGEAELAGDGGVAKAGEHMRHSEDRGTERQ